MKTSFYNEEELKEIGLKVYGKNVLISRNATIYGADKISIGDNVRIDDFCILSGNISLGSYIHIAAYCGLFGGEALTNPMLPDKFRNVTEGTVTIKKHSIVGTGSSILPNVTIGEGCSVGSMSLVSKSIDDWGIYAGIPCKRIKERKKDLLALEKEFLKEE